MKASLAGFFLSSLVHLGLIWALLNSLAASSVPPKAEKVVPIDLAMFEESVAKPEISKLTPKQAVEKIKLQPYESPKAVSSKSKQRATIEQPKLLEKEEEPKKVVRQVIKKKAIQAKPVPKKSKLVKQQVAKPIKKPALKSIKINKTRPKPKNALQTTFAKKPRQVVRSGQNPAIQQSIKIAKPNPHTARQKQLTIQQQQKARALAQARARAKAAQIRARAVAQRQKATTKVAPKKQIKPVQTPKPSAISIRLENQYKLRLQQLIAKNKNYPIRAKRRNLEGTVTVSFVVQANGAINNVKLVRSSGSRILDKAAIRSVQRASGQLPFSKGINRKQWRFTLPLIYRLR